MKRTVMLIIFLIFVASILLIYAINSQPVKKTASNIIISPTQAINLPSVADSVLYFFPDYIELTTSDSATIDIMVNSGKNQITGIQLEIGYNPKVFSDITFTPGDFLPKANVLLNKNDKLSGRISYALVLPPTESPAIGTGKIAKLNLRKFIDVEIEPNPTTISILPKSLVSAIGIEGSVLKEVKNADIIYIPSSGPATLENLTPKISQSSSISP